MRTRVTFEVDIDEAGWRSDRSLAGQLYATPTEINGGDLFIPGDATIEVVEPPLPDGVYVSVLGRAWKLEDGVWYVHNRGWKTSDPACAGSFTRIGDLSE